MLLFRSAILRAPEDDPSGGGGSGDTSKSLTEEDVARIANQAFTAQIKRLNVGGQISDAIKGLDLDAKFQALAESLKPPPKPEGDGDDGGNKGAVPPEVAKQMQALAEKLEAAEAARQAEREAREAAEQKHQFDAGRQRLYESLKEHADGNLHDVWVDHLIHHGRLKVEDGEPLLEVEYSPVKGMPKEKDFLPISEAIPHLITSQDSKRFMAPPDRPEGGSGSKAPRTRRGAGSFDSKNPNDRVRARLAELGLDADAEFA